MAEALNVKRHQLRRALAALRANGEIAPAEAKRKPLVGHNGENLVRDTNPMEVIEMRIAIEPFLARLAALRASPFEMAAIDEAATTAAGADSWRGGFEIPQVDRGEFRQQARGLALQLAAPRGERRARAAQRIAAGLPQAHASSAMPNIAPSRKRSSREIRTQPNKQCGCIWRPCRSS